MFEAASKCRIWNAIYVIKWTLMQSCTHPQEAEAVKIVLLFAHMHQKPLFFTFCKFFLSLTTHTHTRAHTSWLGVLPQPVICLMNNVAVCHPCWRAESYQPTQTNYNRPVIIPDSHYPLTWTSPTHTSGDRHRVADQESDSLWTGPQIPWGGCYGDACQFPSPEGFCVALNQPNYLQY